MEKQRFGELFNRAWARGREWRLSGFLLLESLFAFVAALPFMAALVGLVLWVDWPKKGADPACGVPAFFGQLLVLLTAGLAAWLIYMWIVQMLVIGLKRETLYPATEIGRGLRSGFARWLTVLYPLPLSIGIGLLAMARSALNQLAPVAMLLGAGGGLWLLQVAVSLYMDFLFFGIAAGSPQLGFGELYRRAFVAFKNGWGRMLLWALCLTGLIGASILSAVPATVGVVIGLRHDNPTALTGGIVGLSCWALVMIAVWIRANVVSNAFGMYLYLDASGTPAELDAPEPPAPQPSIGE